MTTEENLYSFEYTDKVIHCNFMEGFHAKFLTKTSPLDSYVQFVKHKKSIKQADNCFFVINLSGV